MSELNTPDRQLRTTDVLRYNSAGHCLVIGESDDLLELCKQLDLPQWTLCVLGADSKPEKLLGEHGECVLRAESVELSGHLGGFRARLAGGGVERDAAEMAGDVRGVFDTVLDLKPDPSISHSVLPFGYFAPATEGDRASAISSLRDLTGEFEKPRYFRYDESLCAHSASRQIGCTRCIQACDTGAIVSIVDSVEVDPYLCQGCGHCSTVCPTGAMRYAWPDPTDSAAALRTELLSRADRPVLVFYARSDAEGVNAALGLGDESAENAFLPVAVEEVGSVGPEMWWAALAWGAGGVLLVSGQDQFSKGDPALNREIGTAQAILAGLLLDTHLIASVSIDQCADQRNRSRSDVQWPVGRFGALEDKRVLMRMAIEHVHGAVAKHVESVPLPAHSAFGAVAASDACTLCMSCVSVCPANALQDGSGVPALRFIESNCVQCGLCESACPESAITREQRYVFDSTKARETRELRSEDPFLCVECAKPFAVRSVIEKMQAKLADHWMFGDEKSRRRLLMCEDCRVKDQF